MVHAPRTQPVAGLPSAFQIASTAWSTATSVISPAARCFNSITPRAKDFPPIVARRGMPNKSASLKFHTWPLFPVVK